jgi:hypothetical protein
MESIEENSPPDSRGMWGVGGDGLSMGLRFG